MRLVNTKVFFGKLITFQTTFTVKWNKITKSGLKLKIWGTNYYNNRTAPIDNYEPTAPSFLDEFSDDLS